MDYPSIIKHPMDLGTIRTRLNEGYYVDPMGFVNDVRTVFRNCFLYNKKGSDPYVAGNSLSLLFENEIFQIIYHSK